MEKLKKIKDKKKVTDNSMTLKCLSYFLTGFAAGLAAGLATGFAAGFEVAMLDTSYIQ